jgi:hypothetical protein
MCILRGSLVQVSNLRSPSETVELDLDSMIRPILETMLDSTDDVKMTMLYYGDSILAVHVEIADRPNIGYIFAIGTTYQQSRSSRVLRVVQTASNSKLFVRHTSQYLYYGTHTGIGGDGHHKWEMFGVSLNDQSPLARTDRPLLLEDFHGSDVGSTVAFEIHDEHFYAVSNQGTFEVEEVDWTSFYHCARFPLNNPICAKLGKNERVYRRQHAQGPIHDSWTDLSLQISERTNEVLVLESRREWEQASSRQSRTFYTSKFNVENNRFSRTSSPSDDVPTAQLLPENDLFVGIIDSTNSPNFMLTPPQYSWSRHPEFTGENVSPRSFILARTKFRAYNHSCNSFVDLVEDERCCNDPSKPPCLRLRVGSRREASLDIPALDVKGKGRLNDMDPVFEDHVQYRNSQINMWPPPASKCPCSSRLHDILNPPLPLGPGQARTVTGVLDDRTLVLMIKPGKSYGASDDNALGTIVVVDFTRPWKERDSTPSRSSEMRRVDSRMDHDSTNECDEKMADDLPALRWDWSTGQDRICRNKRC